MEKRLDVSMLEPCEPLEQTLEAIQQLASGDYLRVIHRREPLLLYPLLEKSGYVWKSIAEESGHYVVFIWKEDDAKAGAEAATGCTQIDN